MQLAFSVIKKHRKKILNLVISLLLIISFLSPIYFMRPYLKTNSGGFHGGGYDFLAYYSVGKLASGGEISKIYNGPSLSKIQKEIIPENSESQGFMTFLNPPYFAYLLTPLTLFSVGNAQIAWLLISFTLAIFVAYIISRRVEGRFYKIAIFIITINLFPFWQNYRQGQLGILLLFFTLLGISQYQKGKLYQAGALLSILFIKPHLAILAILGLLIFEKRKIIYGMLATITATVTLFLPLTGVRIYFEYLKHLLGVTESHANGAGAVVSGSWEGSLSRTYGLNGALTKLFGQANYRLTNIVLAVILVSLVGTLGYFILKRGLIKKAVSRKHIIVMLLIFGFLFNIHLYAYDLVYLLALPLIIYPKKIPIEALAFTLFALELSAFDYILYIPLFTTLILCGYIGLSIYLYRLLHPKLTA